MKACRRALVIVLVAALGCLPAFADEPADRGAIAIEVSGRMIALHARDASRNAVLRSIGQKTGVEMIIAAGVTDAKITLDMEPVPTYALGRVLERLGVENYAVAYDQGQAAMVVYVLPAGQSPAAVTQGKGVIREANFGGGKSAMVHGKSIVATSSGVKGDVPIRHVAGEILLKFRAGTAAGEIAEILAAHRLQPTVEDSLQQ